jgi:hypothetical protein
MAATRSGFFRSLLRWWTTDAADLDADELPERRDASGATPVRERVLGADATMGRVRSLEPSPADEVATLQAERFDGSEGAGLIRMGRRRIPGTEAGRTVNVRGRVTDRCGRRVLDNPYYELRSPAAGSSPEPDREPTTRE